MPRSPVERRRAVALLTTLLDAGGHCLPAALLIQRGKAEAISAPTLRRAHARAGVHVHRHNFGPSGVWYWCNDPDGPSHCLFERTRRGWRHRPHEQLTALDAARQT